MAGWLKNGVRLARQRRIAELQEKVGHKLGRGRVAEEERWRMEALARDKAERLADTRSANLSKAERLNQEAEYRNLFDNAPVVKRKDLYGTPPPKKTGLLGQEVQKPVANQEAAGATGSKSAVPSASTPAQNNTFLFNGIDAKLKAAKSRGKANAYMAKRIKNDTAAFRENFERGNFQDAADLIGATGKYTQANAQELLQQGYKHYDEQIANGPGVGDYIFGHKIPSTAVGVAIAGGAIAAVNSNGGRRSNADLYSSPF